MFVLYSMRWRKSENQCKCGRPWEVGQALRWTAVERSEHPSSLVLAHRVLIRIRFLKLQQDFEPVPPGPNNPHGNGFRAVESDLTTELKALRCADPFKGRVWKIKNPESIHPITGERVVSMKVTAVLNIPANSRRSLLDL
jgi:hypothetical protein